MGINRYNYLDLADLYIGIQKNRITDIDKKIETIRKKIRSNFAPYEKLAANIINYIERKNSSINLIMKIFYFFFPHTRDKLKNFLTKQEPFNQKITLNRTIEILKKDSPSEKELAQVTLYCHTNNINIQKEITESSNLIPLKNLTKAGLLRFSKLSSDTQEKLAKDKSFVLDYALHSPRRDSLRKILRLYYEKNNITQSNEKLPLLKDTLNKVLSQGSISETEVVLNIFIQCLYKDLKSFEAKDLHSMFSKYPIMLGLFQKNKLIKYLPKFLNLGDLKMIPNSEPQFYKAFTPETKPEEIIFLFGHIQSLKKEHILVNQLNQKLRQLNSVPSPMKKRLDEQKKALVEQLNFDAEELFPNPETERESLNKIIEVLKEHNYINITP